MHPSQDSTGSHPTRRRFLKATGLAGCATDLCVREPHHVRVAEIPPHPVIGTGEHRYECYHDWGQVSNHIHWFKAHGVAVDMAGHVTCLGHNTAGIMQVLDGFKKRGGPERWEAGRFIHPRDACFDKNGNIFVAEWVATGRESKLRKV